MKARLWLPLGLFATLLSVALCTGSRLFLLLAALVALTVVWCLAGVLWTAGTLRVEAVQENQTVSRGGELELELGLSHRGLIPVAPILLDLAEPETTREREIRLRHQPFAPQRLRLRVSAGHVGVFRVGLRSCTVEDLLGLFARRVKTDASFVLTVLPRTFETEPLTLAPGDPGNEIVARATEDLNAPSDFRSYQPGDAMKKIHWKLSLRKNELIVRRFDEPILRDVLILLDCSRPPSWGHSQAEADLKDALLETAASVLRGQMETDCAVQLPLQGRHPAEVEKSMGLPIALDYLARVDFSAEDRFERMLALECRRLRKVGCVVIIAARLNIPMVDVMIRMRRMGPHIRLYLVTFAPEDPAVLKLIARLQQAGLEVAYVTPEVAAAG